MALDLTSITPTLDDGAVDVRHAFLRALHPNGGFRDVRCFGADGPIATQNIPGRDLDAIDAFASQHRNLNIFVGVAERADASGRSASACSTLAALFADIDFKDSCEPEARTKLAEFPLPPSAVVNSGGGLHVYWFLDSPLDLQNGGAYVAKLLLQGLATVLGGDMKSAEPARILRLPDTLNHKYNPPRKVFIETYDDACRYTVEQLARILPAPEQKTEPQPLPKAVAEGSRNETLFKEGARLRRLGWSETEIAVGLDVINAQRCHPPLTKSEVQAIAKSCAKYDAALDTFPTTETGDAEFFAELCAEDVCFNHRIKQWLVFTGHRWAEQTTGEVHRLMLDAVRARQRAAVGNKDRLKWALGGEAHGRQANALSIAQNLERLADAGDNWDAGTNLLGVDNGVIDLETGQLRAGRPEDRITLASPLTYDPAASTAKWAQFVLDVCDGNVELASYLQVVTGYILTGLTAEQCFWIFYGQGSNGKSTFLEMLTRHVIPRHSWTMKFPSSKWSESMSDYQKAQIVGRRLIVSKENEQTQRLNTEFIKSLTGSEMIEARHPYGRPFNFLPNAKFIMAVNHKPTILDETHGMWRRVRLVPFTKTFEVNPAFAESLVNEAAGALAWAVQGAVMYYAEGLKTPKLVLDATKEYQKESDSLAPFFDQRCVIEQGLKVRAQHLFDALRQWYDVRQTPPFERVSQNEFGKRIAADGRFTVAKENRQTFYYDIGLLDMERSDDAPF